jgi:hypothetical protein
VGTRIDAAGENTHDPHEHSALVWTTVEGTGITAVHVTCTDGVSSPIHTSYNYDNQYLNFSVGRPE